MKLFTKYYLAVFIAITLPVLASAQAPANLKIGVVDINRLMSESPQFKVAREKLEDEFSPRQREILALQTRFEERAATLEKNIDVMGATEREQAERELTDERRSIVRTQTEFREDSERRNNEVLRLVQQDIVREVVAYGESEGFDLVLVEGIVYASERVNITQPVLERLLALGDASAGQ
jgi:outer membrane protein